MFLTLLRHVISYLRLQRPDEQPNQLIELHRQDAVHNDAQDLINDTEEDEPKAPTNQSLNLRVVRRWVNILNCASYFAQVSTSVLGLLRI